MCGYWLRSLRSLHLSTFASPNSDRDPIWNSVSISGILLHIRHIPITSNFFGQVPQFLAVLLSRSLEDDSRVVFFFEKIFDWRRIREILQCSIPNPKSGGKNTKIPWISCSASIGGSPAGRHERWPASSSSLTLGSGLARYSSKISISLWPARGLGMSWVSPLIQICHISAQPFGRSWRYRRDRMLISWDIRLDRNQFCHATLEWWSCKVDIWEPWSFIALFGRAPKSWEIES